MSNTTPTVVHCDLESTPNLCCSPDEWLAGAAGHIAAGVRLVELDAIPDGSPWNDQPALPDADLETWVFAPWPGVRFVLPLDV